MQNVREKEHKNTQARGDWQNVNEDRENKAGATADHREETMPSCA
jgi:hypothetical protein